MIEFMRSEDLFKMRLLQQRLEAEGIPCVILDEHTGSLMSGIGNILPRLMILNEDVDAAKAIVAQVEGALGD